MGLGGMYPAGTNLINGKFEGLELVDGHACLTNMSGRHFPKRLVGE